MVNNSIEKVKKYISQDIKTNINTFKIENRICKDNLVATVEWKSDKWEFKKNNILPDERIKNFESVNIESKENDRIVIILESPHKDEYSNEIVAPAMGKTGQNIEKYLLKILNKKIKKPKENGKKYDVILMNAIQYQTSFGIDTEYFRDRVWLTLWNKEGGREEFIEKLKGYKPDIIFNFCTNGSHQKDLIYILCNRSNSKMTLKYIQSLNLGIKKGQNNYDLYKGNEVVCKVSKKGNANVYLLNEFVQSAIEDVKLSNKKIETFKGPHPSSWISKRSKKYKNDFIDKIKDVK